MVDRWEISVKIGGWFIRLRRATTSATVTLPGPPSGRIEWPVPPASEYVRFRPCGYRPYLEQDAKKLMYAKWIQKHDRKRKDKPWPTKNASAPSPNSGPA